MNYLGHLFLSGKNPEIILGNLLEDFIKGNINHPRNNHLNSTIKKGIELHRIIDTYTDTNENVKHCKQLFYNKFGKYSSVIVDVLFDHCIINNWKKFSDEDFEFFRKRIYESLLQNTNKQPENMQKTIQSMIKHDWLKNYIERWGLERAFMDLNGRILNKEIDLTQSVNIFYDNYDFINEQFLIFFVNLKNHCDNFLKENNFYG